MDTEKSLEPDKLWETLSSSQQEACTYFAVSHWGSGVDEEYLDAMGIDKKDIDELVKRDVVDKKPTWEFFQEMADGKRGKVESIRSKKEKDVLYKLDSKEKTILNDFDSIQRVVDSKNNAPRFRLKKKNFHDYIKNSFEN